MVMRSVCVITGTRADYGLLQWVIEGISRSELLSLQLIATGTHLLPAYGLTVEEILADGHKIDEKVDLGLGEDSPFGVCRSIGIGLSKFAEAFSRLRPDIIVILGDRYEILAAAIAATVLRIPIAHIQGGELTEGAIDDSFRHSITKMAHFHFVAAEEYRKRVIQLGESPENVFLVGGPGIDNINKLSLLNKAELEKSIGFQLRAKNLLVTFHPETLGTLSSEIEIQALLMALDELQDTGLIFTMPNADADNQIIFKLISKFVKTRENCCAFPSLGQLRYLSCLQYVDGVIGNSSSGITEAPSFKKGTINIGERQRGRLRATSVIDCEAKVASIRGAVLKLYSKDFQLSLLSAINPYGLGGASQKIVSLLESVNMKGVLKKAFHDME
jgi:GDP/UDP-N,N'-diacetylbacillosamine 2-epimerase (hydrolysing)